MRRLRQFLRRSPAERRLLVSALALMVAVPVLLRCVNFGRLRRWGARLSAAPAGARCDAAREEAVIWAVSTAAALVSLRDSCLAEALAAHWLLAAAGRASVVRIGIAPATGRQFAAHAWLESQGRAVLGVPDGSAYLTLD
jgi:hypothetical protein